MKMLILFGVLFLAACSSTPAPGPSPTATRPAATAIATATPRPATPTAAAQPTVAKALATATSTTAPAKPAATAQPTATVPPGPTATARPASTDFDPTKYIGQGDKYNCSAFKSQADAQAVLRADPSDPNKLESNKDGIACESNPPPYDRTPVPR